jgi:hypothetical protein
MRKTDYLLDDTRPAGRMTAEERGVLALLEGLDTYTRLCAPKYADECAAREMGVPAMFDAARAMLAYAPDSLRRGAIDNAYAELLAAWHVNPDTLEWEGTE